VYLFMLEQGFLADLTDSSCLFSPFERSVEFHTG
jgi:hypothetical protein